MWVLAICLLGSASCIVAQQSHSPINVTGGLTELDFDEFPVGENSKNNSKNVKSLVEKKNHQNITYGSNTVPGQFPYMVVILVKYYNIYYHICGGVIVNKHTILTAAHCLKYIKYYPYYVAVGIYNLHLGLGNQGSQLLKVAGYKIYPYYSPIQHGYPHDIALLYTDCRIKYSKFVKPAQLATRHDGRFSHSLCYVVGWGYTQYGYPHILQSATVYGIYNYHCKLFWSVAYWAKILSTHICMYKYPVSACFGDAGGPLVCRGKVAGIVSWGRTDCSGCFPSVCTRVSSYYKWIQAACILD